MKDAKDAKDSADTDQENGARGSEGRAKKGGLLSRDFILLFFLALFSNCYMAVYYCFEQWLARTGVAPNWNGLLLGVLFAVILLTRPPAILLLLRRDKFWIVVVSLFASSGVLFSYQFLDPASPLFEWTLLVLRAVQGFFLALFSTSVTAVLVSCIPPGQSARGFALFSITFLLPYGIIPSLGEFLLPIVGSEPALYSLTGLLLVPSLVMTRLLRKAFARPDAAGSGTDFKTYTRSLVHGVTHSGLALVYLSMICFSLATSSCIFFMKGLTSQTGGNPGAFFFFYTSTIILVRALGSRHMDRLPCYRVVPVTAVIMASAVFVIAWAPLWTYVPATIVYGLALSLLYPLTASAVYNRSLPETRSANSNLMLMTFDFSAMASPMIGGGIISLGFDYRAVITTSGVMILVCGALFVLDGLTAARAWAARQAERRG